MGVGVGEGVTVGFGVGSGIGLGVGATVGVAVASGVGGGDGASAATAVGAGSAVSAGASHVAAISVTVTSSASPAVPKDFARPSEKTVTQLSRVMVMELSGTRPPASVLNARTPSNQRRAQWVLVSPATPARP